MSVSDTVRHGSREVIYETYSELGFNYRMTDLQAAVGREQLRRLPEIVARRRRLADKYCDRLRSVAGLELPIEPAWARSNWQSFCVRLPAGADQRSVMQSLLDRGISTRRGVMNIHLEGAYADPKYGRRGSELDRSVAAQCGSIILPLYHQMSYADVDYVADTIGSVLAQA